MTLGERLGRAPLLSFFAIVFGITWGLGLVALLARDWVDTHLGPITASHPAFIVAVYAPSLTAIGLTALIEGRSGLKVLLGQLAPWSVRWHWWVGNNLRPFGVSFTVGGLVAAGWALAVVLGGGLRGVPRAPRRPSAYSDA